jgi:cytochrome P450 family 110
MKLLDGPKIPTFVQRLQWIVDPGSYMEKARDRYGDIFLAQVTGFGDNIVLVNHPQAIGQLLTSDKPQASLRDRKQFSAPGSANQVLQPLIGDYSVITLDGDRHKERRKLLMPPFHGDRMRNYGELIVKITQRAIDRLPLQEPFLARTLMQTISLEVTMEAVFGLSEGERYQKLKQLLGQLSENFRSIINTAFLFLPKLRQDWGAWSPWGRFVRLRQRIDDLLYAEIAERRTNDDPSRTDILSLLMSARDEAGEAMSDRELRDELMTLLLAGYETTASAMAWAFYWIYSLPDVREKLMQELASLGSSPDPTAVARLPYLTAVCQESLRIYPVAIITFPRVVREPVELMGYNLQPGQIVAGCIYLTHQREDLYPNPKQFKPERFLERQFSPYEFMPFGGGVRRCIGEALAQFEMKLVVATAVSQYQLALADKRPETPRRRGVTLAPARGVPMILEGKSSKVETRPIASLQSSKFKTEAS